MAPTVAMIAGLSRVMNQRKGKTRTGVIDDKVITTPVFSLARANKDTDPKDYSKIKDVYWRREFSVPSKFLNNFSTIDFFGRKFNCPNNPEEYLTFAYGDWQTPLRTSDKDLYNSDKFKDKRISFLRDFKNSIKRKIYNMLKGFKV